MKPLPKKFLSSKERKDMWKDAKKLVKKVDKALKLSEIHVVGSYVSNKKHPEDIDFVIITKAKGKKPNKAWPVDFIILPESENVKEYLAFFKKYMKKKHGADAKPVRLK